MSERRVLAGMPTPARGWRWRVLPYLAAVLTLAACESKVASSGQEAPVPQAGVTFNKDVAPILYKNCASCHRPVKADSAGRFLDPSDPLCIAGAPFSLLDYDSARARASDIVEATSTRAMPPWLPEPGHGTFANERRLRDDEIATLRRWLEEGAVEGDAADKLPLPSWPQGWQLGTPDLVLEVPQPYPVAGGRADEFRNFVLPAHVTSTRYVRGIELRADNPAVLHHANLGVDASRSSRALDRADPAPGFAAMPDDRVQNVYGWSPGKVPAFEPAETAWALEPGSDLVVQLHMVGSGAPARVQPAIGLFFSDTPPTRTPVVVKLESKAIDIPAGQRDYAIEDSYVLPVDADAVSVYPHAHALATRMTGEARLPDGRVTPLLSIARWDLRWQDQYRYASPVFLPRGTTVSMRFVYDNSASNPANRQRPPRQVLWGPNSTDEMGALWLEVVPRRAGDAAVLEADYFRRALLSDIAGAEMAVRAAPADAAAHNRLAMKYVQAGRIGEASAQLERALALQPGDAEVHSNLGSVRLQQQRAGEAMTHLREAARLRPGDDRVRVNLANGLAAGGRLGDAVRELRRAVALNGENADAHFNLAMLLGPQGRVDEAIVLLRRTLEIDPRNGEAHRNLAVALGLQGRIDAAIPHAEAAVRLLPASAEAREHLQRLRAVPARR